MKRILAILILLLCFGCNQEEEKPKIEIYLLNKYVEPIEGIPFKETEYWKDLDSTDREWYADYYIDSITGKLIFGRKFNANQKDLQDYPFIKDNEILGFYPDEDRIVFDSIVQQRIAYLFPGKNDVQFALTVDKEPVLTGYFWASIWSRFSNTYHIYNMPASRISPIKEKDTTEVSYFLDYKMPKVVPDTIVERPAYTAKLINAFRESGRLRK